MGRQNSLSGGNPQYTTHLVASHRLGEEDDCSNNGFAVSLLNMTGDQSVRYGFLLYKQLICPMMY